jgi:hypothetical protein
LIDLPKSNHEKKNFALKNTNHKPLPLAIINFRYLAYFWLKISEYH